MPKRHKIHGLNVNVTSHLFATVHILNETVWENFPSIRQEPVNSPYHTGESTFVMQYDTSEIWSFHSSNYKGYSFLDVMPYGLKVIKCIPPKHWYLFTRPHGITSQKSVQLSTWYWHLHSIPYDPLLLTGKYCMHICTQQDMPGTNTQCSSYQLLSLHQSMKCGEPIWCLTQI